jgi:hypothetical protein
MSPQHSTFEALYGIPYLVVNGNPPNETYLYEIYLSPKLLLHQHGYQYLTLVLGKPGITWMMHGALDRANDERSRFLWFLGKSLS